MEPRHPQPPLPGRGPSRAHVSPITPQDRGHGQMGRDHEFTRFVRRSVFCQGEKQAPPGMMYVRISGGIATVQPPKLEQLMGKPEMFLYASCTSCRKAEDLLFEKGVEATRRDYFKNRFSRDELVGVLQRANVTPFDVLSTRSRSYKELDLANRTVTSDELIDLMVEQPQLLKRPIIIKDGRSTVGFNRSAIEA